ncbi:WD repeat-containing protein 41 [Bagarius yarrelli]|uniref:WD repeat-containing protein 41 n=1 Tax=Bagarius yarrelli TaxID=175774 RepID=A0A556TU41_BAGYA|nr:WD repeat-containing protein 41 [Bagarius yarrelli]
MLRWILGTRGPHGSAENRCAAVCIGEQQPKNIYTELQVLRGHFDIVRFLVQIDDFRFASAGDDGMLIVWNVELWDTDTGQRLCAVSNLQSSIKCVLVLDHLDVFLTGGSELCVWNKEFQLQCKTVHYRDSDITALVDLPKCCVAAAMDKEIVIFKLNLSEPETSIMAVCQLTDHQDTIRALIRVNDDLFASGSHIGEVILWDTLDWTIQAYERICWEEPDREGQSELKMGQQRQTDATIQHLYTDGERVVAAVGSGLFVYSTQMKRVMAYRKFAHDSDVLYTTLLHNGQVMSCSEDGSVRIWELQELPLPAEPASSGFFGLFSTIGKSSKQGSVPSKKLPEVSGLCSLELVGDLIGHSGAVQMFLSFGKRGVVTCSADHLLIVWKDGERESHLRSLALFLKMEEKGCL